MDFIRVKNEHPTWCGPVAVALLTGCSVNDAAQLFANVQNRWSRPYRLYQQSSRSVRGVNNGETKWVLDLLGYDMTHLDEVQGLSVKDFTRIGDIRTGRIKVLIAVPRHYVVSCRRYVSDNHRQNVAAHSHPMGDEIIECAWWVKQKPYGGNDALPAQYCCGMNH